MDLFSPLRRYRIFTVTGLAGLLIALAAILAQGSALFATEERPNGGPTLWVGETKRAIAIGLDDEKRFPEFAVDHIEDIAVDDLRSVVWIGTRKAVIQHDLSGRELYRYPLFPSATIAPHVPHSKGEDTPSKEGDDRRNDDTGRREVHLSIDPSDGSLWIGTTGSVTKLSADRRALFTVKTGGQVEDMSVDVADGSCWAGLKDRAVRYGTDGRVLMQVILENGNAVAAIAADPHDSGLWAGTKKGLIRFDKNGQEQFRIAEARDIVDLRLRYADGSLWAVTKRQVFRFDRSGKKLLQIMPCPPGQQDDEREHGKLNCVKDHDHSEDDHDDRSCRSVVTALAVNQAGGSAFVAWNKGLAEISTSGSVIRWFRDLKQIEAIDIGMPELSIRISIPAEGASIDAPFTTVSGTVSDTTAKVIVNGREATVTGTAFEAAEVPLSLGTNTITAAARNIARLTASDSVHVTRRLDLPPLAVAIESPVNGDASTTSRVEVKGSVNDPAATVVVNGVKAAVAGNRFTATDVPVFPGENLLTASAFDAVGRTASASITVRYPWIDLLLQYPLDGETTYQDAAWAGGSVSDPGAAVTVNGIPATVMSDGSFWTPELRIAPGWNTITAQATNAWGQVDTETARVEFRNVNPQPLGLTILAPADSALISVPVFTVLGIVSDRNAEVIVNNVPAETDNGLFRAVVYTCDPVGGPVDGGGSCTFIIKVASSDGQLVTRTVTYRYDRQQDPVAVRFSDPSPGRTVTVSPAVVTGIVHDSLAGITPPTVTVNGIDAALADGVFTALVHLDEGRNPVTVTVRDMLGHEAYDAMQVVYEPPSRPLSVAVTAPIPGAVVNTPTVAVSGIVSDSTAGIAVNGVVAVKDFRSFRSPSVALAPGANVISVVATRPSGETAEAMATVIYDPAYPSPLAPQLALLPEYSRSPVLEGTGLAAPLQTVELFVNGTGQGISQADSAGLFRYSIRLPQEGPNHITARAVDAFGNRSVQSAERIVTRDTLPPPLSGTFLYIDYLNLTLSRTFLSGQTEASADVTVEVDGDPDAVYRTVADDRGEFTVYLPLSAGSHIVALSASDKAGNHATSTRMRTVFDPRASVFYESGTLPPQLDPLPTPVNESSIAIEGNAYARFEVEIYRNDELMGTVRADHHGRFRLDGVSLLPGVNRIRALQTRAQIDLGPQTFFLPEASSGEMLVQLISGQPARPLVKFDFPLDGSVTNAGHLPLRGTVSDGVRSVRLNGGYASSNGYGRTADGRFTSNSAIPLLPGWNILWVEATAADGSRGMDKIAVRYQRDAEVPSVALTEPPDGSEIYDFTLPVSGTSGTTAVMIVVNESEVAPAGGAFSTTVDLLNWPYGYRPEEHRYVVTAWAMDNSGRIGHTESRVPYRYVPVPEISVLSPANYQVVNELQALVTGTVTNAIEVLVNGRSALIDAAGAFSLGVDLVTGINKLNIIARNGPRATVRQLTVYYYPAAQITPRTLSISPDPGVVPLGGTIKFTATMTYSNGQTADLSGNSTWTIGDPYYGEGYGGSVRALHFGRTTVTAQYGTFTATAQFSVTDPALKLLTIAYEKKALDGKAYYAFDDPVLAPGGAKALRVLGFYTSSDRFDDLTALANWSSSDPAVAAVDSRGKVTAGTFGRATVTASFNGLSASLVVTVAPTPVQLFIISPADGYVADKDGATVRGYVFSSTEEVGVQVNGIPATVHGTEFVANHVPLGPTSGLIMASAIDTNGTTADAKRTVTFTPSGNPLRMTASIESGTGPLETVLRIDGIPSGTTPDIGFTGPGPVEFTECTDPTSCKVRMTVEGIYTFTVTSPGYDGKTYSDKIAVTVVDKAKLDALLKRNWEGMKGALVAGDLEKALNYFVQSVRDHYRQIFNGLGFAEITALFAGNFDLKLYSNYEGDATCGALRTENGKVYSYPVLYYRDIDGAWKIRGM